MCQHCDADREDNGHGVAAEFMRRQEAKAQKAAEPRPVARSGDGHALFYRKIASSAPARGER